MQKCANVPLAIKSIASLLVEKNTITEWKSFKDKELSKIGDSIMSTLKLSYNHLPSDLKHCFAYCSLFPQDYIFVKEQIIWQWVAQGYVNPNDHNESFEEAGHAYFMELLRKSFFQEPSKDKYGEIRSCKMHDLIHDLAKDVAGKEVLTLTAGWNQFHSSTRHLCVSCAEESSRNIPQSLIDANHLRSCLFGRYSKSPLALDPLLTKLKLLRSLGLSCQKIENVPSSIGDLKHLRYLDLSWNKFTSLPDSLTKLVNLLTLDVNHCRELEALPADFRKLINLRHLHTGYCKNLRNMPPGLGELTCLQRLSCLSVGKETGGSRELEWLAGSRLTGELEIRFDWELGNRDYDDKGWQLPTSLQEVTISEYPGRRIPDWKQGTGQMLLHNLVGLDINYSRNIKHLPPLRCLPYLKMLSLTCLWELEYVEEEEEEEEEPGRVEPFFPCLDNLLLFELPKLRGWSRESGDVEGQSCSFPLLSAIRIRKCEELESMPLCPNLEKLDVTSIKEELMQQLLSGAASKPCCSRCPVMVSSLAELEINECDWLQVFSDLVHPCLWSLEVDRCANLKKLELAPRQFNNLQELTIRSCQGLTLWEEDEMGVDWDSLRHLCRLCITGMGQPPETLPHSLQQLKDIGQLQIYIG